jgi:hypothetical protein
MKKRIRPHARRSPWLALVHTAIQLRASSEGTVTLRTSTDSGFGPVARKLEELTPCEQHYLAALGVLGLADEAFG